jgi:hypothetical protein
LYFSSRRKKKTEEQLIKTTTTTTTYFLKKSKRITNFVCLFLFLFFFFLVVIFSGFPQLELLSGVFDFFGGRGVSKQFGSSTVIHFRSHKVVRSHSRRIALQSTRFSHQTRSQF